MPVHVAVGLSPPGQGVSPRRQPDGHAVAIGTTTSCRWSWLQLQEMDFDLNLTGFSARRTACAAWTGRRNEGLTDPDDVPEPPDEAITQPGDLWILGNHRLLCGDSSKAEDVDRLLDGALIHLVNTDPPYNVKVEPRSNNAIAAGLSARFPRQTTHHQAFDVARHREKASHRPKAARQGPAAGQRLRHRRGIRPPAQRLVRQHGPRPAAGPGVLHLGRLRQLRQLPAGPESDTGCTSARPSSGTSSTRC